MSYNHKKLKLSAALLLGLGLAARAQQVTTASGGSAMGDGGTVAYSVGQVAYTTITGTTGSAAQGVQHTYEYEIITVGIKDDPAAISLSVYPNPTSDNLILHAKDFSTKKLTYELLDGQGKLVERKPIRAEQTPVNMNDLVPAIYFIHVTQLNKQVRSFKIIKI
jgi:Secretion system C-terminal sorting domain